MATTLDGYKAELLAAKTIITPQIEGLHDFARLNLHPDTAAIIAQAIDDFERRLSLIDTSLDSLKGLQNDNYPNMDSRSVLSEIYSDLQANVSTIEAAFQKFEPEPEARTVTITAGTPESK